MIRRRPRKAVEYTLPSGRKPFSDWLLDRKGRAIILRRISQAEEGNLGDYCDLHAGLYELRIHYGPGYRIYFALEGNELLVLLAGGDTVSRASSGTSRRRVSIGRITKGITDASSSDRF